MEFLELDHQFRQHDLGQILGVGILQAPARHHPQMVGLYRWTKRFQEASSKG